MGIEENDRDNGKQKWMDNGGRYQQLLTGKTLLHFCSNDVSDNAYSGSSMSSVRQEEW
jgi:hypothetical protein